MKSTLYEAKPPKLGRNLSLSEIAYLLGYSELSAFSRTFRRWTGLSPREYRGRSSEI